jgi:hypothetical protein
METPNQPPRRISGKLETINLTGMIFPWKDEQPVWLSINGSPDFYLPVFTTPTKLRRAMKIFALPYESVKRIDDHHEFLESIPLELYNGVRIRIIIDARRSETDTILFTEVYRRDQDIPVPYYEEGTTEA